MVANYYECIAMATNPKRRAPSSIFDNLSMVGRDCVVTLPSAVRPAGGIVIDADQDYAVVCMANSFFTQRLESGRVHCSVNAMNSDRAMRIEIELHC